MRLQILKRLLLFASCFTVLGPGPFIPTLPCKLNKKMQNSSFPAHAEKLPCLAFFLSSRIICIKSLGCMGDYIKIELKKAEPLKGIEKKPMSQHTP